MRTTALFVLIFASLPAMAQTPALLTRAVSCQLTDAEIPSLPTALNALLPEMRKAKQSFAAPSGALYQLEKPVSALGYTSTKVLIQPARILLVVPEVTAKSVNKKLQLTEEPYSPASRSVRPTVSIVRFQLHQEGLAGNMLIGCEYAQEGAAKWLGEDIF